MGMAIGLTLPQSAASHLPLPSMVIFTGLPPALELTLTDERDETVARRVLLPADYLGAAAAEQAARGIGAGAEVALRVLIDTSGLRAIGYRMYLFFP